MDIYLVALISAAKRSGLKVPKNLNTYNPHDYSQFHILYETVMIDLSDDEDSSKIFYFHRWVLQVIEDLNLKPKNPETPSKRFG